MADTKTFLSNDNIDKVIYAGSTTVNSGSSTTIDTGIGQYGLALGIYSTDGGATWSDCESPFSLAPHRGLAIFGSLSCGSTGILTVASNPTGGASNGVATQFKFVLLQMDTATATISNPVAGSTAGAYSSSSSPAYRTINQSGAQAVPNDGSTVSVVLSPTGLPMANFWAKGYGGTTTIEPFSSYIRVASGAINGAIGVWFDAGNIYMSVGTGTTYDTVYYRTYKESNV